MNLQRDGSVRRARRISAWTRSTAVFALISAVVLGGALPVPPAQAATPTSTNAATGPSSGKGGPTKASVGKDAAPTGAADAMRVAADPAGVWRDFLAYARFEEAFPTYAVLGRIGYSATGVDTEGCEREREALAAAVRTVPVSLVLHRASMLCADARGDAATAERELQALAALSKHALREHGDGAWRRPIQVLRPEDLYALIAVLGYEFSYEYYERTRPRRYFPMTVAAWDPEEKFERHLEFDFVDATARIDRDDPMWGYPYHRVLLAQAYVKSQSDDAEAVGADMDAVIAASREDAPAAKAKALQAGASAGGMQSAYQWLLMCGSTPFAGCADGLVDALLPLAEKKQALPMLLLSMAYREGIGLKKDPAAAATLLKAADARWHRRGATVMSAVLWVQLHETDWPADLRKGLVEAAAQGNADAEALLVVERIHDDRRKGMSPADRAFLEQPANNGVGYGFALLARHLERTGQTVDANGMRRRAADAGDPESQFLYAQMLREGADARARGDEIQQWVRRSAEGAHVDAMRSLSRLSRSRGEWESAANWLLAAVRAGDVDAILDIASLMEEERPGLQGKAVDAVEIYRALDEENDLPEARRRLAQMALDGRGMAVDLAEARRLLVRDAQNGDEASQTMLGMLLLNGALGNAPQAEGARWLRSAIDAGSQEARDAYASWLLTYGRTPEERRMALQWLREIESRDHLNGRNNLAWFLCVSPHADVRDPAVGLDVAKRLARMPDLPAGYADTVAACHAASGDYAQAVRVQREALDALSNEGDGARNDGMRRRLALYQAGKPYIEDVQRTATSP